MYFFYWKEVIKFYVKFFLLESWELKQNIASYDNWMNTKVILEHSFVQWNIDHLLYKCKIRCFTSHWYVYCVEKSSCLSRGHHVSLTCQVKFIYIYDMNSDVSEENRAFDIMLISSLLFVRFWMYLYTKNSTTFTYHEKLCADYTPVIT